MRSRTARIAALDPIGGATPSARPRADAQTARDAFDLQNDGGNVCRALQHLTGPPIESAAGFEDASIRPR
jgi:hypothetical protein